MEPCKGAERLNTRIRLINTALEEQHLQQQIALMACTMSSVWKCAMNELTTAACTHWGTW